ncbi:unnamed protein product [Clavelina lepadiformis]|uniref:Uncharacterized protein n=1 Tax=Clavelina lepadiformis TaxID=159417 RepID=A0ABP0GF26_CLALP
MPILKRVTGIGFDLAHPYFKDKDRKAAIKLKTKHRTADMYQLLKKAQVSIAAEEGSVIRPENLSDTTFDSKDSAQKAAIRLSHQEAVVRELNSEIL